MSNPRIASCPSSFAWGRWVSLYCAFSFIMLGADAAMSHYSALGRSSLPWIPVVFAPAATVLCVAAVFSRRWRRVSWVVGAMGLAVGGTGTFLHNLSNFEMHAGEGAVSALLNALHPPLAPAAFAATGLLMLLVGLAEWCDRRAQVHLQTPTNGRD